MKRTVPAFLSLLVLMAFSLTARAQNLPPAAGAGQDSMMMQMGAPDEDMDMRSGPDDQGRMCGPGCSCDKCRMAGKKGGMMGMHGDIDMMTRPGMNKSCRTPEFYLRHKADLGLSPYQVEALDKLYASLKRDMITKGAAVKVLELDLGEIVTKADFKLADAQDKLKEVEKARTDLRMAVLKASSDARDVLSPEQLEKLKEMDLSLLVPGAGLKAPPEDAVKEKMMEKMRQKMMQ